VNLQLIILYIDEYTGKLFRKDCFAEQGLFSTQDPYEIIPKRYQERRNDFMTFKAFSPGTLELKSDQETEKYKIFEEARKFFDDLKDKVYILYKGTDKDLGKPPLTLRMVPLPDFTVNQINFPNKEKYGIVKYIIDALLILLLPRRYKINRHKRYKLSPFSRVMLYRDSDDMDMYDNPAIEAVINFRWQRTKFYYLLHFLRFLIFAVCFGLVSWTYLSPKTIINEHLLLASIVIFYYLALYLFLTELIQLIHGGRKYFDIFNFFDVISNIIPVTTMSLMLKHYQPSHGFESTIDPTLVVWISVSIFILWIETVGD